MSVMVNRQEEEGVRGVGCEERRVWGKGMGESVRGGGYGERAWGRV